MKDTVSMEPTVKPTHVSCIIEINNTSVPQGLEPSAIPYIANQPMDPQLWDGNFCPISLFGLDEYLKGDTKNIMCSLLRMVTFIKQHKLENRIAENISQILEFGFTAWEFLSFIYESGWDKLIANKDNKTFRQYISSQFNMKPTKNMINNNSSKDKQANILRIPLPILSRPSKSVLAKSNFFKKNLPFNSASKSNEWLYVQISKDNIKEIVKIKETFLKLSSHKVMEIYKVINNMNQKNKSKINIMTKGLSRKQIIIPMSMTNIERVIVQSNAYIVNINRLLKRVKSNISVDYICSNNKGIIIITNKVATSSNLNIMKKYVKELNNVDVNDIMSPRLSQSVRGTGWKSLALQTSRKS